MLPRTGTSRRLSSSFFLFFFLLVYSAAAKAGGGGAAESILHSLQAHGFRGSVYPHGTGGYAKYRPVEIAECNVRYPLIIVRPVDTRDVAIGIKVAREQYVDVSVRSGGHGYNCNSIKNGSMHFDMRRINHVEVFRDHYTQKPLLRMGPGSTWDRVLRLVPEEQFTYVHGSCSTVGVGGYLLGGGSNVAGPPMRYGSGAENVLEYTMVTADGEVLTVDKDGVTKADYDGEIVTGKKTKETQTFVV